ncbi:MAG TPA: toll/interleukin-1 receptor domain-containing protein, partial [Ktedonobacteraceae bacterium]|nr:toll/interleukin-1 receptor domain-containing protein [Ktedonobacteraceae bacterium]
IDDYRTRMMHPIQYYSCFISYAHQDDALAHRLHSDLQDKGVRCWFAPHNMRIGDKIRPRIDEAIHLQDKLLLILSEHSVASDWVEHEVETALARARRDRRTILFPIRLDNAILERGHIGWPALVQNERHIGDFTGWKDHDRYQAAFDRLLRDLKKADEPPTTTQDMLM